MFWKVCGLLGLVEQVRAVVGADAERSCRWPPNSGSSEVIIPLKTLVSEVASIAASSTSIWLPISSGNVSTCSSPGSVKRSRQASGQAQVLLDPRLDRAAAPSWASSVCPSTRISAPATVASLARSSGSRGPRRASGAAGRRCRSPRRSRASGSGRGSGRRRSRRGCRRRATVCEPRPGWRACRRVLRLRRALAARLVHRLLGLDQRELRLRAHRRPVGAEERVLDAEVVGDRLEGDRCCPS